MIGGRPAPMASLSRWSSAPRVGRGGSVRDEGCDGSAGRGKNRRAPAQEREARRCAGGAAPGAPASRATTAGVDPAATRAGDSAVGCRAGGQDLSEMRWPDACGGLDLAEVRVVPRVALCQLQRKGHGALVAVQGTAEADARPRRSAARCRASRRLGSGAHDAAACPAITREPRRYREAPPGPPCPAPLRGRAPETDLIHESDSAPCLRRLRPI
jgi:hypothetical protein